MSKGDEPSQKISFGHFCVPFVSLRDKTFASHHFLVVSLDTVYPLSLFSSCISASESRDRAHVQETPPCKPSRAKVTWNALHAVSTMAHLLRRIRPDESTFGWSLPLHKTTEWLFVEGSFEHTHLETFGCHCARVQLHPLVSIPSCLCVKVTHPSLEMGKSLVSVQSIIISTYRSFQVEQLRCAAMRLLFKEHDTETQMVQKNGRLICVTKDVTTPVFPKHSLHRKMFEDLLLCAHNHASLTQPTCDELPTRKRPGGQARGKCVLMWQSSSRIASLLSTQHLQPNQNRSARFCYSGNQRIQSYPQEFYLLVYNRAPTVLVFWIESSVL